MLGLKVLHKGDQLLNALVRHGIVDAGAHAADTAVTLEAHESVGFSFLDEDQKIQGLNYLENYGLLFVSVSSDQAWSKQSIEHLYICSYKDGVLQSETPESCD